MKYDGDYRLEILDKDVKIIKQVKLMSSDVVKPRYRITYVIVSNSPKTKK
ncbi:hypothetical protein [Vulcanisaeta distributa]|nr:hypothetical protein [Vulcanisaeta distributa]